MTHFPANNDNNSPRASSRATAKADERVARAASSATILIPYGSYQRIPSRPACLVDPDGAFWRAQCEAAGVGA